jgi:hypothetical protein
VNTAKNTAGLRQRAIKEIALFTGLLFVGLVILPVLIYSVGQSVFGAYGGVGYTDFFGTLGGKIRQGDIVAWFLILSPYLGWQCLRLTMLAWRLTGR